MLNFSTLEITKSCSIRIQMPPSKQVVRFTSKRHGSDQFTPAESASDVMIFGPKPWLTDDNMGLRKMRRSYCSMGIQKLKNHSCLTWEFCGFFRTAQIFEDVTLEVIFLRVASGSQPSNLTVWCLPNGPNHPPCIHICIKSQEPIDSRYRFH
jgi:hypothetical protein